MEQVSSKTIEVGTTAIISGLDNGDEYFFRVRAVNEQGKSGWTPIKSCKVGQKPAAPTTWSSSTTAIVGEKVILYWVHNTNDGSKATKADLELRVNGVDKSPKDFTYTPKDEDEETTYQYTIDTNAYSDGATIQWRVRTAGVTGVYGDWSVQRTIDIYAPPTLELHLTNTNDEDIEALSSFPLYVKGIPGPQSQSPIGYHLTVVSTEDYETEDQIGNEKFVSANEEVYSKFFDIKTQLLAELSANNIDLENGKTYKVSVRAVNRNSADGTVAYGEWSDAVDYTYAKKVAEPKSVTIYAAERKNQIQVSGENQNLEVSIKDEAGNEYYSYAYGAKEPSYVTTSGNWLNFYENYGYLLKKNDTTGLYEVASDADGKYIGAFQKGKKYTVKVRAYTGSGDEKKVGDWSNELVVEADDSGSLVPERTD